MPETKLQRAGRLTIRKLMRMIAGDKTTSLDYRADCGFCAEYWNRYVCGSCDTCPLFIDDGCVECTRTDWYKALGQKENNHEEMTADCQALIQRISALTGAPIPKDLEE